MMEKRNTPLPILAHPHSLLKRVAKPVDFEKTTVEYRQSLGAKLARSLMAVKYGGRLGLAATQIGLNERVAIVDGILMFNPTCELSKAPMNSSTEGCYSVPNELYKVDRANTVWATWKDVDGNEHKQKFNGLRAVILQHEVDHLDGKCIADVGEKYVNYKENNLGEPSRTPQSK